MESATIVANSSIAIGTETSFTHIACAADIPNLTIMGGGHFSRFVQYHKLSSIVYLPLDCYLCNWQCKYDKSYCIDSINPEIITNAINDIIDGNYGITYEQNYIDKPYLNIDTGKDFFNNSNYLKKNYHKSDKNNPLNNEEIISSKGLEFKTSAIVSIYNSYRYMNALFDNLLNQSLFKQGGMEIIMIDSNSPQNEIEIIKPYLDKYPNSIKYQRTPERETLYKAWNRAIEMSKAEYITNANTDDRHRSDAIEIMTKSLDLYRDYAVVYPDMFITPNENETFDNHNSVKRYEFPDFNVGSVLSSSCFGAIPLWRRNVHDKIGFFDDTFRIAGDYDFFIRLVKEFKAIHIRETLGLFLQGNSNLTSSNNIKETLTETMKLIYHHRKSFELAQIYSDLNHYINDDEIVASAHWDFALLCMLSPYSDFQLSLEHFQKAIALLQNSNNKAIIQEMLNNNLGIINIALQKDKDAFELWNRHPNSSIIQKNILTYNYYRKLHNKKIDPILFNASMVDNNLLKSSRTTNSLYLDENNNIKMTSDIQQYFWDVYFGNDGVNITNKEKIRAKQLEGRSPKTEGYIKSYHLVQDPRWVHKAPEKVTSFSKYFWSRNYNQVENVIIKVPNAIGDSLAITTICSNLKAQFPHLKIHIICSPNSSPIYYGNELINSISYSRSFDADILEAELENSLTIDYTDIIGKLPEYYNGLSYLDIFGNIAGIELADRNYYYYITDEEKNFAKEFLNQFTKQNKIGIHLYTSKDIRRSYPHSSELAKMLITEEQDNLIINFGNENLNYEHQNIIDLAKLNFNIRQQIAIAEQMDKFIVIDSAFLHIAQNLFKKPTYAIFGTTNPHLCGNPRQGFRYIRNERLDCLSCYWQKDNGNKCMSELSPSEIINSLTNDSFREVRDYENEIVMELDTRNYEEFLYKYYFENRKANKLKLIDSNNILPDYAKKWNGINVI